MLSHRNNLWDRPGGHKKKKALNDASVNCSYSLVRQQPEDGNQGTEEEEFSQSLCIIVIIKAEKEVMQ